MIADKYKVQIAMARACLTTREIAKKADMPLQSVKNVVGGKRSVRPETIGRVAKVLQVDVTFILKDEKKSKKGEPVK